MSLTTEAALYRIAIGLLAIFALSPTLRAQEASSDGPSGTKIRFANLMMFREEARILMDDEIAAANIVSGEITDFVEVTPGQHRVFMIPRYGKGELLRQEFKVEANSKTTLVLAGGPTTVGTNAPATVIPLIFEESPQLTPKTDAEKAVCTIIFANGDVRGPIKVEVKIGTDSSSFDLAPGKTKAFEKFPIGSLDLQATPLFKLANGDDASASLNSFTPDSSTTYYCVFYTVRSNYPTRALFLSNTAEGDLGRGVTDDR